MNITQEQAIWIAQNILWLTPLALFIFTSIVIGFWNLIGKLFVKSKRIPQDKEEVTSSIGSMKQEEKTVIKKQPLVPVELNKEGYVDLTE